ncbi:hypothetical protein [Corynebacterium sp. AOP12-C2-36]|uniref:hypothetical protein n=1 Tax=Corynebacterium sp. AOP12-C2-36 TaxID=3457723 RepID=UPI00403434F7
MSSPLPWRTYWSLDLQFADGRWFTLTWAYHPDDPMPARHHSGDRLRVVRHEPGTDPVVVKVWVA